MIYPHNIHNIEKNAGKTTISERVGLGIFTYVFANLILFYSVFEPMAKKVGVPIWCILLGQALFSIITGIGIFRKFVIKEDDNIKEYEASKSDSLARYYYVRKDSASILKINNDLNINIYEYSNSNFMFVMKLRYGSNDKEKSDNTFNLFTSIFNILNKNNLEYRTYNMRERYEDSSECDNLKRSVANIEQDKLQNLMLRITENMLNYSYEKSDLYCTNIVISTRNAFQFYDIQSVLIRILGIISTTKSCIRSVEFLNENAIRALFREYYGLEAIDLSMLKAIEPSVELLRKYRKVIQLYKMVDSENNIIENTEIIEKSLKNEVKQLNKKKQIGG